MSPVDDGRQTAGADPDPMQLFVGCHDEIREGIASLEALARALAGQGALPDMARVAADVLRCFDRTVTEHHREEERELWPMIRRSARGEDAQTFEAIAARLQREHHELEASWAKLRREVESIARRGVAGGSALDVPQVLRLAEAYRNHALFEDEVVVPMAHYLLSPTEQNRLRISVALRRLPVGKGGFV